MVLIKFSKSRRSVISGFLFSPLLVVESRASAIDQAKRHADALAGAMQEIHGGEWKTFVDHENLMAAVMPKLVAG